MKKRQKPDDGCNDKNSLEPNSKKANRESSTTHTPPNDDELTHRWNIISNQRYSPEERIKFRKHIYNGDSHKVPSAELELYWGSNQKEDYRLSKFYNPLILALKGEWTKLQIGLNTNDFKPKQFLATFESLSNRLKIKKNSNAKDWYNALSLIAKAGKTKLLQHAINFVHSYVDLIVFNFFSGADIVAKAGNFNCEFGSILLRLDTSIYQTPYPMIGKPLL